MSSTLGSNSGSQQPFMRAKHFETVSQQLHHRFHHKFHHNLIIARAKFFFVDWGLQDVVKTYYIPHPSWKYYTVLLYATMTHR